MLFTYLQTTQRFLADTKQVTFNIFDLRDWINTARSQIASEGEAARAVGTLNTAIAGRSYNFSQIVIGGSGAAGVIAVRQIWRSGAILTPREWEWFVNYHLAAPAVPNGPPGEWAQLAPGLAGNFYVDPIPDAIYGLSLDCVVNPAPLNTDSDTEILSLPFTDAVSYYAAYMAFLTVKDFAAAENMYGLYERFMMRARGQSTPTVLPRQYPGGVSARDAASHMGILNPAALPGGRGQAPPGA